MSATATYSRIDTAFRRLAVREGLTPFEARVLVAIRDIEDPTTLELEHAIAREGSSIRRAVVELYASGHALGEGSDGGTRRRGVRSRVFLTDRGRAAVDLFDQDVARSEQEAAAG